MENTTKKFAKHPCIARFADDGRTQSLKEHAEGVAKLAHDFASIFGLGKNAKILGLNHDHGKNTSEFQEYLHEQMGTQEAKRKNIRHSIHGARLTYDNRYANLFIAEMLSNCIASHHGSLRDFISPNGKTPLLTELGEILDNVPDSQGVDLDDNVLLAEIKAVIAKTPDKAFAMSMLTKLL